MVLSIIALPPSVSLDDLYLPRAPYL
jgi:hypothetical protein